MCRCVCRWVGEGGEKGTGEVIHLFQTVWGEGEGNWEGDSLISNCIEKSSQ